ncbi:hypothetical protein E3N88_46226 [Mikania micrantha]|uniref:Uncharacterized protein n=1 Tax=Mikania micrantha TaxID=192012 RepID=A0A5N6L6V7_9ASTR|nr:hypothetical protein E3N88_46226 [Mikania micrantha]
MSNWCQSCEKKLTAQNHLFRTLGFSILGSRTKNQSARVEDEEPGGFSSTVDSLSARHDASLLVSLRFSNHSRFAVCRSPESGVLVSVLEMDLQFDILDELTYVKSHLSNERPRSPSLPSLTTQSQPKSTLPAANWFVELDHELSSGLASHHSKLGNMTFMLIRRTIAGYHFQLKKQSVSSSILRAVHGVVEAAHDTLLFDPKTSDQSNSLCYNNTLCSTPLIAKIGDQSIDYKIDIVDDDTWQASTGFADAWKDTTIASRVANQLPSRVQIVNNEPQNSKDPDFDEIDDLRICGNLFFKLDKDSKEYEEYSFDFHRKKSCKSKTKETQNISKKENEITESKMKQKPRSNDQKKSEMINKLEKSLIEKKQRVPTFNQLTGPYHEPFCLDVYISKASVRACIVHRATSKVVAVAHSISKDMKFDLGSTKNIAACTAVGKVLAQRALADDIHNVVYTPRKGEKLEGKLQIVVESLINNGLWVKIKLKKKNVPKHGPPACKL